MPYVDCGFVDMALAGRVTLFASHVGKVIDVS